MLLALRFEEQLRLGENAFTNRARALAPSRIELLCGARVATQFDEDGGQTQASIGIEARHRHQILHRHLRGDLAHAHVLLNRVRQHLDQPQAARHPTGAAVETTRQLVE